MRRRHAVSLNLVLLVFLIPASLYAWEREGHEIVAMLAEQRLLPEVRKAVDALLEGTSFAEASTWADRERTKETAPWHYVNIPIAETQYHADKVCPNEQCVIGQMERFRKALADPATDVLDRQKALKYLIHFVADLHQPLHAGDNDDRGGNDVHVEFLGQTINPYNNKPWNLHAVWDRGILETNDPDAGHYAKRLNASLKSELEGAYQDGSVVDWAMESHLVAKEHVYALPDHHRLGEEYYELNVPVVDQQLVKAGVRLSKVLNEALAKE